MPRPSKAEIESALLVEVGKAQTEFHEASSILRFVTKQATSGMPQLYSSGRIRTASKAFSDATSAYARALREFNAFILEGVVPERFK